MIRARAKSRLLTPGEIEMTRSIFGSKIDYSKPRIYNRSWIIQSRHTAMTPDGNIYMRGDGTPSRTKSDSGGLYREDFSVEPNLFLKAVFIHEMAHVWQWQVGMWIKIRAINRRYFYDFKTFGQKDFKQYGIEEQAQIVEDFYLLLKGGPIIRDHEVIVNHPSIESYRKLTECYFP